MSTPNPDTAITFADVKPSVKPGQHINAAVQQAIIAAVASGIPQTQVALQFGVHRNTVYNLCRQVKALDHPSNPLAKDFKKALTYKAVDAVSRGLDSKQDPYRAADIGVKVLTGLGEFTQGNAVKLDADLNIVIQWGRSETEPIDVTPLEEKNTT